MERRTAIFFLNDGKEYEFAERNREDINYTQLQNKFRASRIRLIKDVHNDPADLELRDALIFQEWGRQYVDGEVWSFISDDIEEKLKLVYASFKICNPAIDLEAFRKLVNNETVTKLLKEINKLEQDEPALDDDVCKELKIDKKKFLEWKKNHPEVYYEIKKVLKKKVVQKSAVKL